MSIEITEYFCPKCNSTEIEHKSLMPPPKVKRISMDDIPKDPQINISNGMMIWHKYEARCKKCGYKVEYIR